MVKPSASGGQAMRKALIAIGMTVALTSGLAHAQYWGYNPYAPPNLQYRPTEPSNARGMPPAALPTAPTQTGPAQPALPPSVPGAAPYAPYWGPPMFQPPPTALGAPPPPSSAPGFSPPPSTSSHSPWPSPSGPIPGPSQATLPLTGAATSYPVPATTASDFKGVAADSAPAMPPQIPATISATTATSTLVLPSTQAQAPSAVPWSAHPSGPATPASAYPSGTYQSWTTPYASPPSWGQPPLMPSARSPRLEVELNEHQPYVQQQIPVRIRVVSEQNLATATPEIPSGNELLLQKLEGPHTSSRGTPDGRQEIVNEFIYTLMPLRSGEMKLPSLRVTGETATDAYGLGRGQHFDASGGEAIQLQVRPAPPGVEPWLPLRDLSLKAHLDGSKRIKAGQPISLVMELSAVGATGSQLPSLEPLLDSPDFRVYREQILSEGKVSTDGQQIEGKRTEHYTLVPRQDGRLRLPEIGLSWWNLTTNSRNWASLTQDSTSGEVKLAASGSLDVGPGWLSLGLVILLLPFLGFGVGLWYRGRSLSSLDRQSLNALFRRGILSATLAARRNLARVRDRHQPAPLLHRFKQAWPELLPPSSRFLRCLRAANHEPEPAPWARRFQEDACQHLKGRAPSPPQPGSLPGLAGQILRLRPGADPQQLVLLLRQLDGALYGGQAIDFARWKKDFSRQVSRRQGLFRRRARTDKPRIERPRLPELNPRPVG